MRAAGAHREGGPESRAVRSRPEPEAEAIEGTRYGAVRKNEEDSVWFPPASIERTSHS